MGLDEALSELDDADASPEEVAKALEDRHPKVYKEVYSDGFGAGKTSVKDDLSEAEEKMQQLEEEREKLQSKVETLQEEQPEAAELRGKYEDRLEKKQQEIQSLQEKISEKEEEKNSAIRTERESRFRERLINRLQRQGVDSDYAEVKADRIMNSDRVQFNGELEPEVYEEGGEVPTPGDGDPVEKLTNDVLEDTPDKFIADERPGSTGLGETKGSPNAVTISREEARNNPRKYEKKKEEAEEQGKELEIVD